MFLSVYSNCCVSELGIDDLDVHNLSSRYLRISAVRQIRIHSR